VWQARVRNGPARWDLATFGAISSVPTVRQAANSRYCFHWWPYPTTRPRRTARGLIFERATDNLVGLIRIAGRRGPGSAGALHELDRGQEGAALVAVRGRVVLDEVPAQDGRLCRKLRVRLDAAEAGLRCAERGGG
jgi:hypothetical protein